MADTAAPTSADPSLDARPLISACLIVKDEEATIERCLQSLSPLVDEIVVHDTGSTDRTVELCRTHGARVILGEWREDFAWARNVGIDAADGEWVLVVDADEAVAPGDVATLRQRLRDECVDAYHARVNNVGDAAGRVAVSHSWIRLFRRSLFRYRGRIHEQVTSIADRPVDVADGAALELTHWGYLPAEMEAKAKVDRNIRMAEAAVEHERSEQAILHAARALSLGDDAAAAIARVTSIRHARDPEVRHQALQLGVQLLISTEEAERAWDWLRDLLTLDRGGALTGYLHGRVLFMHGRYAEAIEILRNVHADTSLADGVNHTAAGAQLLLARCLAATGADDEALAVLEVLADGGPLEVWPALLELAHRAGAMPRARAAFTRVVTQDGGRQRRAVLAAVVSCEVDVADAFAEALHNADPGDTYALATAVLLADRLSLERALTWSSRARAVGLADSCPLLRQAAQVDLIAPRRVLAAAAAVQAFADPRAGEALSGVARDLADDEVLEVLYAVGEAAPSALEPLVLGVVSSQRRGLVMARALTTLNAREQAVAVLRLGLELDPDTPQDTPELRALLTTLERSLEEPITTG